MDKEYFDILLVFFSIHSLYTHDNRAALRGAAARCAHTRYLEVIVPSVSICIIELSVPINELVLFTSFPSSVFGGVFMCVCEILIGYK